MNNRLSALIERARSHKPVTILTLIGVLVLPAILGGVLVAALQDPTQRLDTMTAAIVNDDKPVTVNGQLAPLGRQLAAGLVDGTGEKDENLTWVISNEKDAAAGLKNGTYQAVVRIPEGFSAAAVSGGTAVQDPAKPAKQATISVTTAPQARAADGLIANQIANVAASTMGSEISQSTLKNVLVGFGTLGDKIGEAANGADKLATGAASAATGAGALPDGATKLADGAGQLSDGAGQLSSGLGAIADGITASQTGANQAGAGLAQGADALAAQGLVPAEVSGVAATAKEKADTAAANTASAAGAVGASAQDLGALAQQCATDPTIPAAFCQKVGAAAASAGAAAAQLGDATKDVYVAAGYADGTVQALSQFNTAATAQVSGQLRTAADGINQLSAGLGQLADGTRQSATGAENLATGATGLQSGAAQLADGATQLSSGIGSLATGTSSLASGLHQAAASLPKHTDSESSSLAEVIANPVKADTTGGMFGPTAVPLLAAVVLWFGGLVSFLVMRPFTASALTSRRASATLALRGFAPAAVIGAAQGMLVAVVVEIVAQYDASRWWGFAGVAMLAGVAFAAVNQALVAALGGLGRWLSAVLGVAALAAGIISTLPGWLATIAGLLPTSPAATALLGEDGVGSAVAALVVWALLALIVTTLAVAARRTTSAKRVLAAA